MANLEKQFSFFLLIIIGFHTNSIDCGWPSFCKLPCKSTVNIGCECYKGSLNCKVISSKANEFRQWMIDAHNKYRDRLASGNETRAAGVQAANMNAISWDYQLEYLAYCHARLCDHSHQHCRRTPDFAQSGENLFFISLSSGYRKIDTKEDVEKVVSAWYGEVKFLDLAGKDGIIIDKYQSLPHLQGSIGHFTAVVWGSTAKIGCARGLMSSGHETTVVCNYGPAGNVIGTRMFKRGAPCSSCDGGLKCNPHYPALCGDGKVPPNPNCSQLYQNNYNLLIILTLFCCIFVLI